jgi:two-component system, LytTR family, sensor histidine kinase AlgZ
MAEERRNDVTGSDPTFSTASVLPDFCSGETVLRVFIVVMLVALVIVLLKDVGPDPMLALLPIAMFIAWVAFSSLLLLCLLQSWLRRLPIVWQAIVPTVIPVINTALVHWGAEQVLLADSGTRLRVITAAGLLSLIAMRYLYLVAAWKEEVRMAADSREQALRARVRPHFLFNSMNSIASLCRTDPGRAEQFTLDLADLFRASFATGASHSLGAELDLARAYLKIEQTRFGDRLALEWDVAPGAYLDMLVPTLALQPLVENAVQHGIAPSARTGRIWVRAGVDGSQAVVEIANTAGPSSGTGTQTATTEARARLHDSFGAEARIESRLDGAVYRVQVTLPSGSPEPGSPA